MLKSVSGSGGKGSEGGGWAGASIPLRPHTGRPRLHCAGQPRRRPNGGLWAAGLPGPRWPPGSGSQSTGAFEARAGHWGLKVLGCFFHTP